MPFNPTKTFFFFCIYFNAKALVLLRYYNWRNSVNGALQKVLWYCAEKIPLKVTNLSFETWSLHMLDSWLNSTTSRGGKWDPNGLLRQTYRNSNKTFQNLNLASFYLCLLMNINTSARPLWNAISREKKTTIKMKSHKYTHYFRERFTFSVFFFSYKFVFGQFPTWSSSCHSHSATSYEYDNVGVKEKSVMCHAS